MSTKWILLYLEEKTVRRYLRLGGLKVTAVVLEDYDDLNDWESSQTLWLFKHAKIINGFTWLERVKSYDVRVKRETKITCKQA